MLNWKRYVGRKKTERLLLAHGGSYQKPKLIAGKVLKETAEEGGGKASVQLRRRASENNSKNSCIALSSLTDNCRPAHMLLSPESFQIRLPTPVAARGRRGLLQRRLGGRPAPLSVLLRATNRRAEQSRLQTRCLAKAAAAWQPTHATVKYHCVTGAVGRPRAPSGYAGGGGGGK